METLAIIGIIIAIYAGIVIAVFVFHVSKVTKYIKHRNWLRKIGLNETSDDMERY
ncbi:hypothetical protein LCGC14_1618890 [marine sediment metagenome]|uniref:Uncharacterized protein n=1 Tax=marine sediment metagenome TaxID=412755 RepID=A0A0F9I6C2_9ZZZZ